MSAFPSSSSSSPFPLPLPLFFFFEAKEEEEEESKGKGSILHHGGRTQGPPSLLYCVYSIAQNSAAQDRGGKGDAAPP